MHEGRRLSRAGSATREPKLAPMAPPEPYGGYRQRQVEERIPQALEDYGG